MGEMRRKHSPPFYHWLYKTSSRANSDPASIARSLSLLLSTGRSGIKESDDIMKPSPKREGVTAQASTALVEPRQPTGVFGMDTSWTEVVSKRRRGRGFKEVEGAGARPAPRRSTSRPRTPSEPTQTLCAVVYASPGAEESFRRDTGRGGGRKENRRVCLAIDKKLVTADEKELLVQLLGDNEAHEVIRT